MFENIIFIALIILNTFFLSTWAVKKKDYKNGKKYSSPEVVALYSIPVIVFALYLIFIVFYLLNLNKLHLIYIFLIIYFGVFRIIAKKVVEKDSKPQIDRTKESTILNDDDWNLIDGEACRVIKFEPLLGPKAKHYALIILECKKFTRKITAYITHKIDFQHLWQAFKERGVEKDEEVIISYSKKYLKNYAKPLSRAMPKLWIMICKKGAFELITNPESHPELQGEARFLAERPIVEWKPDVMK